MAISHVIRGEDHVPNTPKYLLLWEALGLGTAPIFAHLPLLVNEQRKKLSKRRDKVALEDYRDEGYLPEAMFNYLALLGWSPGGDRGDPFPPGAGGRVPPRGRQVVAGFLRRAQTVRRKRHLPTRPVRRGIGQPVPTMAREPVGTDRGARPGSRPDPGGGLLDGGLPLPARDQDEPAEWAKVRRQQPAFVALLEAAEAGYAACEWEADAIREATVAAGASAGVANLGKAQAPVRLAVTGRTVGPPLFESLVILGRRRTVGRLQAARQRAVREDEAAGPGSPASA